MLLTSSRSHSLSTTQYSTPASLAGNVAEHRQEQRVFLYFSLCNYFFIHFSLFVFLHLFLLIYFYSFIYFSLFIFLYCRTRQCQKVTLARACGEGMYLNPNLQTQVVAFKVDGLQQHPGTALQHLQPWGSADRNCPVVLEAHGMEGQNCLHQLPHLHWPKHVCT